MHKRKSYALVSVVKLTRETVLTIGFSASGQSAGVIPPGLPGPEGGPVSKIGVSKSASSLSKRSKISTLRMDRSARTARRLKDMSHEILSSYFLIKSDE